MNGEGWRWDLDAWDVPPQSTISVIEKPSESYEGYRERKNKEEAEGKPQKIPFGFHSPEARS